MSRAWDRLEDETDKAWTAFCLYLGLGVSRSIDKAYHLTPDAKLDQRANSWWYQWSTRYDWVARARAYDEHELEEMLEARYAHRVRVRQIFVDAAEEAARLKVAHALHRLRVQLGLDADDPYVKAAERMDRAQLESLSEILDRAGILIPKQLEVSGRDGKPMEMAYQDALKLPTGVLEQLLALIEATGDDDGHTSAS